MKIYFYIAVSAMFFACTDGICYTKQGCNSKAQDGSFKSGQYWVNISSSNDHCVMCMCAEVKRFTNSCIEIDEDEDLPLKKDSLIDRLLVKKPEMNKNDATFSIRDVEVELSESEAKSVECGPTPTTQFDPTTEKYYFPNLKYVHYLYLEKESYCCTNTESFSDVDPTCEVKFDDRCRGQVVTRDNHKKFCQESFTVTSLR